MSSGSIRPRPVRSSSRSGGLRTSASDCWRQSASANRHSRTSGLLAGRAKRSGVGPLDRDELDDLLRERWETPFDRHTTARIHRLSGGNPFYAHEIARSFGGQDDSLLDERLAVPPSLRALVAKRVAALRPPTRKALLAASALSAPTVPLIAAATGRRDDRAPALAEAEAAGVVEVEFGEVRFTHPLLAAAAYADAGPDDRRKLHRRLARIVAENEESARHLALAAERPNAKVADVLEAAAQSASSRGALDEAVTLGEQAWRPTPDDATVAQQRRQVDAAFHHLLAGDTDRARELGQEAAAAMPRGGVRARALLLLGSLDRTQEPQGISCIGRSSRPRTTDCWRESRAFSSPIT